MKTVIVALLAGFVGGLVGAKFFAQPGPVGPQGAMGPQGISR